MNLSLAGIAGIAGIQNSELRLAAEGSLTQFPPADDLDPVLTWPWRGILVKPLEMDSGENYGAVIYGHTSGA